MMYGYYYDGLKNYFFESQNNRDREVVKGERWHACFHLSVYYTKACNVSAESGCGQLGTPCRPGWPRQRQSLPQQPLPRMH